MFRALSLFVFLTHVSAFAAPGDLKTYKEIVDLTTTQISQLMTPNCSNSSPAPQSKIGAAEIKYYTVTYETVDVSGNPTTASGAMAVPDTGSGPYAVVSYQHGTTFGQTEVPSGANGEALVAAACYGSQNNIVVEADYLGYGVSTLHHPYLHVHSESTAAVDMLRAARQLAAKLNLQLSPQLFLTGYSQGGAATMALHKYIQENLSGEFTVTASTPMAGPYNLEQSILEGGANPSIHAAAEFGYVVWGLNPIYHFVASYDVAVQQPYAGQLDSLFDGTHDWTAVLAALPTDFSKFIVIQFAQDITGNPDHPFRQALRAQNVDDWKPQVPMLLLQGDKDIEVPTSNTTNTCAHMQQLGAPVQCQMVPGLDHESAFTATVPLSIAFFNRFTTAKP